MTNPVTPDTSVSRDSLNKQQDEEGSGIKFKDWGFKIDRLFEVALRFYKRNESKAFHPSFDERNQLNALILQARYGNYDDGKCPDIGVLDLVGKNRRHQWSLLKGMSKMEAKSKFICTVDKICPYFEAYAEAVKLSSDLQLDTRADEAGRERSNSEQKRLDQSESNEQLNAIRTSLQKQTYNQFKIYAEKQCPNDVTRQKYLITSLQEQYYQQYVTQMHPELNTVDKIVTEGSLAHKSSNSTDSNHLSPAFSSSTPCENEKEYYVQSTTSNKTELNLSDKKESTIDESLNQDEMLVPSKIVVQSNSSVSSLNSNQSKSHDATGDVVRITEQCSYKQPTPINPYSLVSDSPVNIPESHNNNTHYSHTDSQSNPLNKLEENFEEEKLGSFESYPEPKPVQQIDHSLDGSLLRNTLATSHFSLSTNYPSTAVDSQTLPPSFNQTLATLPQLPYDLEAVGPLQNSPATQSSKLDVRLEPQHQEDQKVPQIDPWSCGSSSGTSSPLQQSVNYDSLEAATFWTKKGVQEFKDSLMDDKHGGTYIVKQGTLLIIQVPTYPDGKFIYWEFVTDHFDIGFGVDFVYDSNLIKPLALKIYEESDDDDEEDFEDNLPSVEQININSCENGHLNGSSRQDAIDRKIAEKAVRVANTISVVPTYRRESHEEVFVGRHKYPGRGYYLLKFDNTYSVLRSKTLFFRICYFI